MRISPGNLHRIELYYDYVKEICDAVTDIWQAMPERKVILHLPATLEIGTPNYYDDQIELMHTPLARRDSVIISVPLQRPRHLSGGSGVGRDGWCGPYRGLSLLA